MTISKDELQKNINVLEHDLHMKPGLYEGTAGLYALLTFVRELINHLPDEKTE